MRGVDSVLYSNVAATQGPFELKGGKYAVSVIGSNFGTVKLQKLGPNGSTYLDIMQAFDKPDGTGGTEEDLVIGTFGASGVKILDLAPGRYQFAVSSATAVYAEAVRIPSD